MRPHRALFHLVLRHTVWKVLLLLLLLAAAQWSAFLCLSPDPASIGLARWPPLLPGLQRPGRLERGKAGAGRLRRGNPRHRLVPMDL